MELALGREGLIHISNLATIELKKVEDAVNIGDMVWVKITEIDDKSRINLSRKNALSEVENK